MSKRKEITILIEKNPVPEGAKTSKLVWWLALLAGKATNYKKPKVGDWVVENTHLIGFAKRRVGLVEAVGKLISIENSPTEGEIHTIETLEGKTQVWKNSSFSLLEEGS